MTAQVLIFNGITSLDVPADRVLEAAIRSELESVVIMGYREDGSEFFASSIADGGTVIWLVERLKQQLLNASAP